MRFDPDPLGLPKEIDAFFTRALMRDPAGRYQSAEEFAAAFDFASSFASMVPSNELVVSSPSLPIETPLPAVVQNAFGASGPSAPLEKTMGTFQAATMPKVDAGAPLFGAASS